MNKYKCFYHKRKEGIDTTKKPWWFKVEALDSIGAIKKARNMKGKEYVVYKVEKDY